MNRAQSIVTLVCLCLLLFSNSVLAQVSQEKPFSPQSPINLNYDWSFEINQAQSSTPLDHRQLMVASGCDVNGDGYEDVLVGDRDYDSPSNIDNGKAWLFYGSASGLNSTPDRTFNPPYTNTYGFFGSQVSCAGDVNGDEYDDILIGMDNYEFAEADEGAVFVWYGSATGPQTAYDWMARGNSLYAHFAISLDAAGDVNGDSYDDIIVGAWRADCNTVSHAYVWFGGQTGLGDNGTPANADWIASDPFPSLCDFSGGDAFGRIVRGIGDVNGDTYDDIMVSAPNYDGGIYNQGAVFIWLGSASGLGPAGTLANADWMAVSGQDSSRFGMSGDGIGDLNGDGFADLAVGAFYYDNPEANEGAVFVWHGSASGLGANGNPTNADWSAEANISSIFGFAVRPAGDVNGDGLADLLVTAPSYPVQSGGSTMNAAGAWFVWFGASSGLGADGTPANADVTGYGDQIAGGLGRDEAAAGDVSQDGLDDIFVAAWIYDHGEPDEGMVFGYYSPFKRIFIPAVHKSGP